MKMELALPIDAAIGKYYCPFRQIAESDNLERGTREQGAKRRETGVGQPLRPQPVS